MLTRESGSQILIDTAREFYTKGWMVGTSGNLSLRLTADDAPLEYLMTASGRDKGQLTPGDILRCGLGGKVLDDTAAKSSAETMLHEAIYQRFDTVQAVYHIHSVSITALSMLGADALVFEGLEMIKGLGKDTHDTRVTLPMVPNTQDITGLSQTVGKQLNPDVPGLVLQGHGLYAWGDSPEAARRHIEIWDFLFQAQLQLQLLKH